MYGVSDPFAALEHPSTRVHLLRPIPYIRISNALFSEYPFRPKIAKDEFLEMLKVDYENLGKEIARKHSIVHNPAIFYSLIKEGVKHGFKL
jgi:hypothetical protein